MRFFATRKRSIAIGLLAGCVAVAAFATIAPPSDAGAPPEATLRIEALDFQAHEVESPLQYLREEQFQRGDTLAGFLDRLGIDDSLVSRLARAPALRALRPGTTVLADVLADGTPKSLSYLTGRDTQMRIVREGETFRAVEEQAPLETRVMMKSSVIRSSLFAASDAAGIPDSIAMQLADVFGGDIDFYRDLRKGDRFSVVYELHHLAGRPVRAGRLLAAEFVNQGRTLRAVHFGSSYYAPDGRNLRKAFLRAP
ncbi:MAG: M23 family peptidase, partial [Burkholderiales bacterium]